MRGVAIRGPQLTAAMPLLALAMPLFAMLAAGCGPNCQSTCRKVYAPEECDVRTPGVEDWTEMFDDCVDRCEAALKTPGELGGYDPKDRVTDGRSIDLENERQAAAWMDCVTESACERLEEGYCEPI